MKEYKLKTAQNGFAAGPAFLIETAGASRAYEAVGTSRASDPETEFTRFCDAVSALEKELSTEIIYDDFSQMMGAYGAALYAFEKSAKQD